MTSPLDITVLIFVRPKYDIVYPTYLIQNTRSIKMSSIKKNARIVGILYLLLIPFSVFGMIYVPSQLLVTGNGAATASNIVASESQFRWSIIGALTVQVINIFLVVTLYKLLRPVNKTMAVLMVVFSLVAVPIAMLNELNHFAVVLLSTGAENMAGFSTGQLQALIPLFLDLHEYGLSIASIFWGLWLFPMGYLIYRSGYIPKFLGVLLMIGCFGYLIDSLAIFLLPGSQVNVATFTFWGEILFPLWLLIKGVDIKQFEKHTLESARSLI
jgi:hypothetical protein